jgi:hypothetical protein
MILGDRIQTNQTSQTPTHSALAAPVAPGPPAAVRSSRHSRQRPSESRCKKQIGMQQCARIVAGPLPA